MLPLLHRCRLPLSESGSGSAAQQSQPAHRRHTHKGSKMRDRSGCRLYVNAADGHNNHTWPVARHSKGSLAHLAMARSFLVCVAVALLASVTTNVATIPPTPAQEAQADHDAHILHDCFYPVTRL
jgi:hypothetical protein